MKLCITHKLEIYKRGYGPAEGLKVFPTAYRKQNCIICNGTMNVNREVFNILISTGASPVKPDGSAGLSESRVTQTDPEKQLGLHDGINQKPK